MDWPGLVKLMSHLCEKQGDQRSVLLVLEDKSFHVKDVLSKKLKLKKRTLLGFTVFADDPSTQNRTETTKLLFVRPDSIARVELDGMPEFKGIIK